MEKELVRIDNVVWWVYEDLTGIRRAQPLCPVHSLRMYPSLDRNSTALKCADCPKMHSIPRAYEKEMKYVLDRVDSKIFKTIKVLNLDDEALPLAKDESSLRDSKYFIVSSLTKSKSGLRLVVYAGEKGREGKTQIFVEPDIKRLAFDQKDLHPTEVFTKLEATFSDGTQATLKKGKIGIE